jgi:hypothetical protein
MARQVGRWPDTWGDGDAADSLKTPWPHILVASGKMRLVNAQLQLGKLASPVLACAGVCWYVLTCAGICWHVLACTDRFWHATGPTTTLRYTLALRTLRLKPSWAISSVFVFRRATRWNFGFKAASSSVMVAAIWVGYFCSSPSSGDGSGGADGAGGGSDLMIIGTVGSPTTTAAAGSADSRCTQSVWPHIVLGFIALTGR